MNLAPIVQLSGFVSRISDGRPGVFQTVRILRQLVNEYKSNLQIRQAAISLIYLTPEKLQSHEVNTVFEFVRDRVRYLRDIWGVETVSTPDKVLESLVGDCDDQSLLLATMLESIGYQTRFVVTGYSGDNLDHIFIQVAIENDWVNADPTEHYPLGYSPPDPSIIYVENV